MLCKNPRYVLVIISKKESVPYELHLSFRNSNVLLLVLLSKERTLSVALKREFRLCGILISWGPFLERPGKLTGPVSYFEIKVSRKPGCVLASNEDHFVSLAENFTV